MARGGPPPKPTHLKLLEGNPGKQKLNLNEPKPRPVAPSCPSWLTAAAKAEWKRLVPELDSLGLLSGLDRGVFAAYCQAWARWREAEELLEKHGLTYEYTNKAGEVNTVNRPEVVTAHKYLLAMTRAAQEMGFSPASRSRVRVDLQKEADDMERLLNGR